MLSFMSFNPKNSPVNRVGSSLLMRYCWHLTRFLWPRQCTKARLTSVFQMGLCLWFQGADGAWAVSCLYTAEQTICCRSRRQSATRRQIKPCCLRVCVFYCATATVSLCLYKQLSGPGKHPGVWSKRKRPQIYKVEERGVGGGRQKI